jgi:hypothetical protein
LRVGVKEKNLGGKENVSTRVLIEVEIVQKIGNIAANTAIIKIV